MRREENPLEELRNELESMLEIIDRIRVCLRNRNLQIGPHKKGIQVWINEIELQVNDYLEQLPKE